MFTWGQYLYFNTYKIPTIQQKNSLILNYPSAYEQAGQLIWFLLIAERRAMHKSSPAENSPADHTQVLEIGEWFEIRMLPLNLQVTRDLLHRLEDGQTIWVHGRDVIMRISGEEEKRVSGKNSSVIQLINSFYWADDRDYQPIQSVGQDFQTSFYDSAVGEIINIVSIHKPYFGGHETRAIASCQRGDHI